MAATDIRFKLTGHRVGLGSLANAAKWRECEGNVTVRAYLSSGCLLVSDKHSSVCIPINDTTTTYRLFGQTLPDHYPTDDAACVVLEINCDIKTGESGRDESAAVWCAHRLGVHSVPLRNLQVGRHTRAQFRDERTGLKEGWVEFRVESVVLPTRNLTTPPITSFPQQLLNGVNRLYETVLDPFFEDVGDVLQIVPRKPPLGSMHCPLFGGEGMLPGGVLARVRSHESSSEAYFSECLKYGAARAGYGTLAEFTAHADAQVASPDRVLPTTPQMLHALGMAATAASAITPYVVDHLYFDEGEVKNEASVGAEIFSSSRGAMHGRCYGGEDCEGKAHAVLVWWRELCSGPGCFLLQTKWDSPALAAAQSVAATYYRVVLVTFAVTAAALQGAASKSVSGEYACHVVAVAFPRHDFEIGSRGSSPPTVIMPTNAAKVPPLILEATGMLGPLASAGFVPPFYAKHMAATKSLSHDAPYLFTDNALTPILYATAHPETGLPNVDFYKYAVGAMIPPGIYSVPITDVWFRHRDDIQGHMQNGVEFANLMMGSERGNWEMVPLHVYTPDEWCIISQRIDRQWNVSSQEVGVVDEPTRVLVRQINALAPPPHPLPAHLNPTTFAVSHFKLRTCLEKLTQLCRESGLRVFIKAGVYPFTQMNPLVSVVVYVA
jgi:hypothetical protein